jgi:hypothetical protein
MQEEIVIDLPPGHYPRRLFEEVGTHHKTEELEVSGSLSQRTQRVSFKSHRDILFSLPYPLKLVSHHRALVTGEAHFGPDEWRVSLRAQPHTYFDLKLQWGTFRVVTVEGKKKLTREARIVGFLRHKAKD